MQHVVMKNNVGRTAGRREQGVSKGTAARGQARHRTRPGQAWPYSLAMIVASDGSMRLLMMHQASDRSIISAKKKAFSR